VAGGIAEKVADGTVNGVAGDSARFLDKHQVLSGSPAQAGKAEPATIPEKPQVLSGSPAPAVKAEPAAIAEKPQVLSGPRKICVPRVMPRRFAEKPQVMSGSARVEQAELAAA